MSGGINDINTPAEMPNNAWTQMIEAIRERNARGAPMPTEPLGVPMTGAPMPAVRSADLGRPVANAPLQRSEIEHLNRLALESGLVRGPVNPSIAETLGNIEEGGQYATLEDAIAAGAPVGTDPRDVAEGALRFREASGPPPVVHVHEPSANHQSAREFRRDGRERGFDILNAAPRLPDFKKVQMIDMVNGKVYVDGMMFLLEPAELKMLRKFCVTKAKEQIQTSLDAAMKALSEDDDGGAAEAV